MDTPVVQRSGAASTDATAIRWGLIGASSIAQDWVLPAIWSLEGHEPIGVCSSDPERGQRFASSHGLEFACSDVSELLGHPAINAVYVSTHNERHLEAVLRSAGAHKHVLCEKPLALSVADATAAIEACRAAGVVLATNHHFRNNLPVRACRDLVRAGEIGRPLAARIAQAVLLPERLRRWRVGGASAGAGAIWDLSVHDVDTLRFVLDDEVSQVTASSGAQAIGAGEVEDAVVGTMRFESGLLATFYDAYNVPGAGSSLEIHGTDGSIVVRDALDERLIASTSVSTGGQTRVLDLPPAEDLYAVGLRRFADAIAGLGAPAASGQDGLRAVAVAEAIRRAAAGSVAVMPAYCVPHTWVPPGQPPSPTC